jgi:hypothetical protein
VDDRFLPITIGAHTGHFGNRHAGVYVRVVRWSAALVALAASAATIRYTTLTQPLIEKRLAAVQGSNAERQQILRELFVESGCPADRLVEQRVKGSKLANVICGIEGAFDSVIVVGAHFDYVSRGKGVVDNWSGASLLPSLYETLKTTPRRHSLVFVGFADEELGLVGSRYYVRQLRKEELRKIHAMVNMDSLGTSPTKLETDRGDKRLVRALTDVADTFHLPLSVVNAHQVGRSDSDTFQDEKIPTINLHSLTQETYSILHSPRDRMDAVRTADYFDSYRLISAYLAYLDEALDPTE